MTSVIVHYQEIALKGKNRPWFVARLVRNLREATVGPRRQAVRVLMGRIEIVLGAERTGPWSATGCRASSASATSRRRAALPSTSTRSPRRILKDLGDQQTRTFRVSARRADKRFPLTSPQIEREVGGRIKEARGWTVNLSHPELTIHVEALTDEAFYFFGKHEGAGGLPVGASGRVVCLLSGGIDSPVAAWRMMRRGCRVAFLHFHSYPVLSRASQEKARELAALLTRFQYHSRLLLVPFADIQQQVDPHRAAAAPRRHLSPPDDADRRGIARRHRARRWSPARWSDRWPRRRSRT